MGFIYKGYLLRSKSVHLAQSDSWTLEVSVTRWKDSDNGAGEQIFSSGNTFSIKELADMESVIFARKIIDGEIEGLSLDDRKPGPQRPESTPPLVSPVDSFVTEDCGEDPQIP